MQPTKQPLIIIEGKNCWSCNGSGQYECDQEGNMYHSPIDCDICHGKAKSPTKLIFDAEDFKGKELPKKGEIRCGNCMGEIVYTNITKKVNGWLHVNPRHYLVDERDKIKPFRLSSDAVLKSVGEISLPSIKLDLAFHNLSESSKIVIAEGYYK